MRLTASPRCSLQLKAVRAGVQGPRCVAPRQVRAYSATADTHKVTTPALIPWLTDHGAPEQAVEIKTLDLPGAGRPLDMVVAGRNLKAGDVAIRVPENLVITLDRIFESEFVAELLTANKLSELACLALYLMYEKKIGKKSFWYPYIKELDKQRARGPSAVESPLLWEEHELETLLQGSPLVGAVKTRLVGIRKEYEALDTVWFMAGSLFNKYPFDLPTETFSFDLFRQAFAAVQASIVHLQGVPMARRFALVPLGPPLVPYSSTCKAMLSYHEPSRSMQLVVDRDVAAGQPLYAWCGPQPNHRLLLNYGIVDENNPFDKLQMTVTIPANDPLFNAKRHAVNEVGLATQQTFDLGRAKALPPLMLPYMRLAQATTQETLDKVVLKEGAPAVDPALESQIMAQLMTYFQQRLDAYAQPLWRDIEIIDDPKATPRQKIAARLTKIEKSILKGCQDELLARGAQPYSAGSALGGSKVRLSAMFDSAHCG